MFLKLMNGGSDFQMLEVSSCSFKGERAVVLLKNGDEQEIILTSNAYILNDDGKTVEMFRPYPKAERKTL
jgi:hypothetical protein